ncbi:uncharacterized protein L969DRAFT_88943 [Mixia osmundae IAM 14324]|uniref:Small ribosomal subunit protein uS9m n=1 Tax=Mixia osmundae (strain CBS 9802 / IAM 14324 / JCM 22182 / KY 12970) TaxID=764103 RepID=G7E7T3_MIXOS|nr:uncharacterized protein L969DRAFT_88943 [Mixia osmundae IAM 14324]KEI38494.1 hypothetical protein L969DRAFT_88943 [Mixia osmundae IAM 14324]GAA98893.1 hypothetical protein E5Q_05581 [Mixia osmundae IAM 14324]
MTLLRCCRNALRQLRQPQALPARQASTSTGAFFPGSLPPNSNAIVTPKPPSESWFTGRPTLSDAQIKLDKLLSEVRSALHENGFLPRYDSPASQAKIAVPSNIVDLVNAGYRRRGSGWGTRPALSGRLSCKIRLADYRAMISTLSQLRSLQPLLVFADSLGTEYLSKDLRKRFEAAIGAYKSPLPPGGEGDSKPAVPDEFGRVYSYGARKNSSARVWLVPTSKEGAPEDQLGEMIVNGTSISERFRDVHLRNLILRPFALTGSLGAYNTFAIARGGGVSGQAQAIQLGIAKCLATLQEGARRPLRKEKLLTRDPRMVERKKTGKPKARKSYTWVKR